MSRWRVEPRAADLTRGDPLRWSQLTVVERHNAVGTWSLTGKTPAVMAALVAGGGAVILRDDVPVMSGQVALVEASGDQTTVTGVSDLIRVADRIVYPDPAHDIDDQGGSDPAWTGTDPRETLILDLIDANAGSSALAYRQVTGLTVPISGGRGGTATATIRLAGLLASVADLAEAGGLHVDVVHDETGGTPALAVTVAEVADVSADVVFGTPTDLTPGRIANDWRYSLARPEITAAIAAGGGEGAARIFREAVDSTAAGLWGARVEQVIDQRQTTDTDELDQAAAQALAEAAAPVAVEFTVLPSEGCRYGSDWRVGDRVGVVLRGLDLSDVVREVTTVVADGRETVSAVVGSRDSTAWATRSQVQIIDALRRLANLERRV